MKDLKFFTFILINDQESLVFYYVTTIVSVSKCGLIKEFIVFAILNFKHLFF